MLVECCWRAKSRSLQEQEQSLQPSALVLWLSTSCITKYPFGNCGSSLLAVALLSSSTPSKTRTLKKGTEDTLLLYTALVHPHFECHETVLSFTFAEGTVNNTQKRATIIKWQGSWLLRRDYRKWLFRENAWSRFTFIMNYSLKGEYGTVQLSTVPKPGCSWRKSKHWFKTNKNTSLPSELLELAASVAAVAGSKETRDYYIHEIHARIPAGLGRCFYPLTVPM